MNLDRRIFLGTLGVGALKVMTPEQKADALEHYMIDQLEQPLDAQDRQNRRQGQQQDPARPPRGTGGLFQPTTRKLEPMPKKPTLQDFFRLRFAPASHVLQSATRAMEHDFPEETILACMLHDVVLNLIKPNHGQWGGQLLEPYVPAEVAWGVRYHAPLRFFPDEAVGYEYPDMYNRMFGEDYVPSEITQKEYKFARGHKWYMHARMVTMNDEYSFDRNKRPTIDPFEDIIGRHFRIPEEGLGNDSSPSAHMWRTIADPTRPL